MSLEEEITTVDDGTLIATWNREYATGRHYVSNLGLLVMLFPTRKYGIKECYVIICTGEARLIRGIELAWEHKNGLNSLSHGALTRAMQDSS